ncbi:uncharacterized protein LOC128639497 [Bombina bombina]|uniref:uncharacterized protein LOC128639497 n=1 Tax=Bombina bombina TaxID=8345 RepID=UPI00235AC2D1|nr:uncharacterized protein LOC128639497 [Bombina bombina]
MKIIFWLICCIIHTTICTASVSFSSPKRLGALEERQGFTIVPPASEETDLNNDALTNKTVLQFLDKQMEILKDYQDKFQNLSRTEINLLVWKLHGVFDKLKEAQSKAYWKIISETKCPMPLAPRNGGLVCVYLANVQYCKPVCAKGYDFSFLRRSRLYEECGNHTRFSWTTQYIAGQRLAECIASSNAVSGVSTAYFDKGVNCQQISSDPVSEENVINTFLAELKAYNINKPHMEMEYDFVLCGDQ